MNPQETSPRQYYQFGNYEIVETLGTGGMGIVYRANDTALRRSVALKILRDDLRSQAHIVTRFQREAEAIAALDHPNIVHVHNVGRIGKIPFIAMEHIDGYTLGDVLRDGEKMDWRDALVLGREVAGALAAAHAAQIIHRDIKPGNILLDKQGKAFVTDFGIAKILTAASGLTVDGSRLGTPQYMCPERCRNRSITPASDLYSLGVVLFQAISGRLPHEAHSNVELIRKITGEAPPRLRSLVFDIPEDVERFIAFLLERDPANRPQHATEVVETIDRILEGKPLDENLDHAMKAIAAYRDDMATPTPSGTSSSEMSFERDPLRVRIHDAWYGLRVRTRIAIAVSASALLLVPIAITGSNLVRQPVVDAPDYGPDYGVARWTSLPSLAAYQREAPGVSIVTPNLAGFRTLQLVTTSADDSVLLRLVAESNEQTVLRFVPGTSTMAMVMPSQSFARESGLSVLDWYQRDDGRWLASTTSGTYAVSAHDASDGIPLWDGPVSASAPVGTDGDLMLATPRSGGGSNLVLLSAKLPDAPEHLIETRGEIVWIGVSDPWRAAYFFEQSASGHALWRLRLGAHAAAPRKIADGILAYGGKPLDRTRDRIVVERSAGRVEILEGESGRVLERLGDGRHPSWSGDGDSVLAASADYADRMQLWLLPADGIGNRTQLTHLAEGIGDSFTTVKDTAIAVSATGEALVVADF